MKRPPPDEAIQAMNALYDVFDALTRERDAIRAAIRSLADVYGGDPMPLPPPERPRVTQPVVVADPPGRPQYPQPKHRGEDYSLSTVSVDLTGVFPRRKCVRLIADAAARQERRLLQVKAVAECLAANGDETDNPKDFRGAVSRIMKGEPDRYRPVGLGLYRYMEEDSDED